MCSQYTWDSNAQRAGIHANFSSNLHNRFQSKMVLEKQLLFSYTIGIDIYTFYVVCMPAAYRTELNVITCSYKALFKTSIAKWISHIIDSLFISIGFAAFDSSQVQCRFSMVYIYLIKSIRLRRISTDQGECSNNTGPVWLCGVRADTYITIYYLTVLTAAYYFILAGKFVLRIFF